MGFVPQLSSLGIASANFALPQVKNLLCLWKMKAATGWAWAITGSHE